MFELKKGTLARDAVAQVLDYASDLHGMDREALARHIVARSGTSGIARIEDFDTWYTETHPDNDDEFAERPRMVLVGLGVDARAKRMVQFLADSGIDIDILTFHAFRRGGQTFLARQVEVSSDSPPISPARGKRTREVLERELTKSARDLQVDSLLQEVRRVIGDRLHIPDGGYPMKSGVTFYRRAFAEDPSGPGRAYASLILSTARRVTVVLTFRTVREGGDAVRQFLDKVKARSSVHWAQGYDQFEFDVDVTRWEQIRNELASVLDETYKGIEAAAAKAESDTIT